MDYDAKCKRSAFIDKSTDIREMFYFAHPDQVLSAVNVHAGHFYGSMLWDLTGEAANQVFRTWNTCVKLTWDIPRWSHNYLVDNLLAGNLPSTRKKLMCQYVNFFQKLLVSPLREVRVVARIVGRDNRSVTGINLMALKQEFNLDPWVRSAVCFKSGYVGYIVPEVDRWRLPLLRKMLNQRSEMVVCEEEVDTITDLIDSLCSS